MSPAMGHLPLKHCSTAKVLPEVSHNSRVLNSLCYLDSSTSLIFTLNPWAVVILFFAPLELLFSWALTLSFLIFSSNHPSSSLKICVSLLHWTLFSLLVSFWASERVLRRALFSPCYAMWRFGLSIYSETEVAVLLCHIANSQYCVHT